MDIQLGDIVRLKSGGPWMTVIDVIADKARNCLRVTTCRFKGEEHVSDVFPSPALDRKVEP